MWQSGMLHKILKTDEYILPYPTRIFQIISENSDKIMQNAASSVFVTVTGLVLGSILGYLAAIGATVSPRFGKGGLTVISAFNAIPIVAMAPVIMNWTKDISGKAEIRSTVAKIIVVTLMCMASMSINAHRGLNELKPFSLDLMKSYAADKKTVFLKLRLPNSIPYVFTALKVSVPASVITALVSEYFAEYRAGVGRQIRENILIAQYATAWAYIAVACLIGIILFVLLLMAESIFLRKRRSH
ncbi:MAG: ABC transporter permease subunit, partial [Clostridia bacterium]|nr:ABC transporter permease subunit [Clostridia bacterium]